MSRAPSGRDTVHVKYRKIHTSDLKYDEKVGAAICYSKVPRSSALTCTVCEKSVVCVLSSWSEARMAMYVRRRGRTRVWLSRCFLVRREREDSPRRCGLYLCIPLPPSLPSLSSPFSPFSPFLPPFLRTSPLTLCPNLPPPSPPLPSPPLPSPPLPSPLSPLPPLSWCVCQCFTNIKTLSISTELTSETPELTEYNNTVHVSV